ncbi:DNA repair protein Nse1 [Venturia nashicola]|uniref:Non-structural maintenance of chromosomes element 1 homolog n=1 Tax=Venturia nashicola TaxID=86259 RepID=A0A4Z1PBU4_9PEZI|nr:DNA repair protein Nse1 [Venturia nashicola]TLD37111.1 DNA repair protein Nse1 [Venturia nashicola]
MASPGPDGHYHNGHRAFLQAFLARPTLTFDDAKPILAKIMSIHERRSILPNDVTYQDFESYINTINLAAEDYEYEIRSTYPQKANRRSHDSRLYSLVNTTSDPQTQLATSYTPDEIAFVKRVLDAMFDTNNTQNKEVMAVKGMDALRLAKPPRERESAVGSTQNTQVTNPTGITQDRAEKLLGELVQEHRFERSRAGFYSLSPRQLMELRGWLVETYNEEEEEWQRIKTCDGCKEIVTVGLRCTNRECPSRFHDFCANAFFRTRTDKKCPTCKTDWTGDKFVGERAVGGGAVRSNTRPSTNSASNPRHSNGTSQARRRRSAVQEEDDLDEEEEEDLDEEEEDADADAMSD